MYYKYDLGQYVYFKFEGKYKWGIITERSSIFERYNIYVKDDGISYYVDEANLSTSPKQSLQLVSNCDFSNDAIQYILNKGDIWSECKYMKPYDTTISQDFEKLLESIKNPYPQDTINLPSNVFFNEKKKATTVMFGDKATVVKCGKDDTYSKRVGFLEAYFQAICGMSKTKAKKYLDKIVNKEDKK